MPTVSNTVTDPAGDPIEGAQVVIRLIATIPESTPAAGFVGADDETIESQIVLTTDELGEWSTNLVANDLITPAGTYYLVSQRPDVTPRRPAVKYRISVPDGAGPYWAGDLRVNPPDDLPSVASEASAVSFNPTGSIAATNVQAAIAELESEFGLPLDPDDVTGLVADLNALQAAIDDEEAARAVSEALLIPLTQKGAANGVAPLGADSKVPGANLPISITGVTPASAKTGATRFGTIPGVSLSSTVGTLTLTADQVRYDPWIVDSEVELTELYAEITTAAAAGKLIRLALYAADAYWQPTGAPLVDSGNLAADPGAVPALVTTGAISVVLPTGRYVAAVNSDGTPALRTTPGSTRFPILNNIAASNPVIIGLKGSQTFPSTGFPDPPTAWSGTQDSGTGGMRYTMRAKLAA